MKPLLLLVVLLLATKTLGDSVLSLCCLLLLGYGIYVLLRNRATFVTSSTHGTVSI